MKTSQTDKLKPNIDPEHVTEIAKDIILRFKLPSEDLSRVVDMILRMVANSNTNATQFAESMNWPSASALGISVEEASAVVGVLSNAGIRGSLRTEALGTALSSLYRPTAQALETLDRLGISPFINGEFVGAAGLIRQLEVSFQGLDQAQRQTAIATIFGTEAATEINVLIGNGADEIEKYTKEIKAV